MQEEPDRCYTQHSRFGEIIKNREAFKCALLPGLLFIGGTSLLKKSDFLGWKSIRKYKNFAEKEERAETADIGIMLSLCGGLTLIAKAIKLPIDTKKLTSDAFPLLKLFLSNDTFTSIAPKMVLVFGITAPVLGLGVARKYYEPEKIEAVLPELKRPKKELVQLDTDLDEIKLNQQRKMLAMHLCFGETQQDGNGKTVKNQSGKWKCKQLVTENGTPLPQLPIELIQIILSFVEGKKLIPTIEIFLNPNANNKSDSPKDKSVDETFCIIEKLQHRCNVVNRINDSLLEKSEKNSERNGKSKTPPNIQMINAAKKACREPISNKTKDILFKFVENNLAEQTYLGEQFLRWLLGLKHAKIIALNEIFSEKSETRTA